MDYGQWNENYKQYHGFVPKMCFDKQTLTKKKTVQIFIHNEKQ